MGRPGFSVNRFDYGISEANGAQPTNGRCNSRFPVTRIQTNQRHGYYKNEQKEDLVELAMTTFAAVSDGHGGDECSNYLVEALPNQLRVAMLEHRVALRERRLSKIERFETNQTKRKTQWTAELLRKTLKTSYLRLHLGTPLPRDDFAIALLDRVSLLSCRNRQKSNGQRRRRTKPLATSIPCRMHL